MLFRLPRPSPVPLAGVVALALILGCDDGPRITNIEVPPSAFATLTTALPTAAAAVDLGRSLFFDQALSLNGNQACAACHAPEWGFTGPIPGINAHGAVYEGSIAGAFGNRKPPSAAYATLSPILHRERAGGGLWVGGNFWDGRATGEVLGNPAADQALGPFLNPKEQALADEACVVYFAWAGDYADLFQTVWGDALASVDFGTDPAATCRSGGSLSLSESDRALVEETYGQVGLSIAAYEASAEVNAFTSKFDAYLRHQADLTRMEKRGLSLFKGKGKCARCHAANGHDPLFTDFTYDNLGVPANPENPALLSEGFVDYGLGGFLDDEDEWGKVKVPTLRNLDKRPPGGLKAYTHN
ncbi:MAG TPA: cytochrome c peroxidase, partial [Longimicrobiales bacterium]|nr:cytochrome c peroxidase [Longimicrobiales bacterium]